MALTATTLSSACAKGDYQIVVASATGFAAGNLIRFGSEVARVAKNYVSGTTIALDGRGLEGTVVPEVSHPASEQVITGLPSDFSEANFQSPVTYALAGRTRYVATYSASGALALPPPGADMLAILNGASVRAMTLANPTRDMDGCLLIVAANGIAAHTITYTAGFGNVGSTADVITFGTTQAQAVMAIAVGGFWNLLGPLATATANVSGPAIA